MAKHKKACDCIFCVSKCPECGSIDINVNLIVKYGFHNDIMNKITFSMEDSGISLQCNDCGEELTYGGDDFMDLGPGIEDPRLQPLYRAVGGYVTPSMTGIEIDGKGRIKSQDYRVTGYKVEKGSAEYKELMEKGGK